MEEMKVEDWRSTSIEKRKNSPFISLLISTYFIAFKFGLGLGVIYNY